ncbi:hypothetical protein [Nonomuraea sp. 10N515B]|uniref:hypothetical protein n=1 Tax=Nonomuraea sp. 10N515B TaxID=3457422 RepID=UPI003FCCE23A
MLVRLGAGLASAIVVGVAAGVAFTRRRRGLIPLVLCSGLLCVLGTGVAIQDLSAVSDQAIPSTFEWTLAGTAALGILAAVLAMPALIARLLRRVRQPERA